MLCKWSKNEDGATAVEFAIVGVPFVFMLIGIAEVSLMYAANSLLQDATSEAARMIRTGQLQQSAGDPEDAFRDEICRISSVFLNCANIQYEVVTFGGGFQEAQDNQPEFDSEGNLVSQGFNPGGVSDVVLIRTVYYYPLLTPFIGPMLADGPNQTKFMMTTMVLQTEPYEFGG